MAMPLAISVPSPHSSEAASEAMRAANAKVLAQLPLPIGRRSSRARVKERVRSAIASAGLVALIAATVDSAPSHAADAPPVEETTEKETTDLAALAQKANNPLSDVWLLLAQNDYAWLDGDLVEGTRQINSLKIQPVLPVPVIGGKWNLITRPVFNVLSVPLDDDVGDLIGHSPTEIADDPDLFATLDDPWGRTTGLGDSVLLSLLGPDKSDGFIWGGGVSQIFPTATEDVLGQGKWQAGPAAIALRLGTKSGGLGLDNWNVGFLAQQWWSYAGDDDRNDTSHTNIQYFLNWRLNDIQLIGMTPNITINWKADNDNKLAFPVGLGTIGMFRLGRLPVRWGVELQYYVVRPDDAGLQWNVRLFLSPIIPNPFK